MAKTKGDKHKNNRLARKWEKLSLVRSRVRKGKDWLKLPVTDSGEYILSTKALQFNFSILKCVLEEYKLSLQDVDSLTEQAGCFSPKIPGARMKHIFFWGSEGYNFYLWRGMKYFDFWLCVVVSPLYAVIPEGFRIF